MKILISGGTGQLGRDCTTVLGKNHQVIPVGSKALDIADGAAVNAFVQDLQPDVILNCAAFTRVDDCETKKEPAWRVNVEGARNLAAAAGNRGARLIHISTDYVFDGKKQVPEYYTETDDAHPFPTMASQSWRRRRLLSGKRTVTRFCAQPGCMGHKGKIFLKPC